MIKIIIINLQAVITYVAKIAVIVGSVRHCRQGINVAHWIEKKLRDRNHIVFFIDPLELDLPLLDRMYKEITNPSERIIDLRNKINEAEGYIPVTPEYNHSTSSALKNTLDHFFRRILLQTVSHCFLFPWNVWRCECCATAKANICITGGFIDTFIVCCTKGP
jgi:NADPH-dependent FMN reductase